MPTPYDDLFTPGSLDTIFNSYLRAKQMGQMGQLQEQATQRRDVEDTMKYGFPMSGVTPGEMSMAGQSPTMVESPKVARLREIADQYRQMQAAQLRETNAAAALKESMAAFGKPPTGFRFMGDGELEAIPGGPAQMKISENQRMKQDAAARVLDSSDRMLQSLEEAKSMIGLTTSGIGSISSGIPMTPAKDLAAKLMMIKSNVGFDALGAIREASKSGGALGQVSEKENELLQSTIAALDQAQSPAQLKQAMDTIAASVKRNRALAERDLSTFGNRTQPTNLGDMQPGARQIGRFSIKVK